MTSVHVTIGASLQPRRGSDARQHWRQPAPSVQSADATVLEKFIKQWRTSGKAYLFEAFSTILFEPRRGDPVHTQTQRVHIQTVRKHFTRTLSDNTQTHHYPAKQSRNYACLIATNFASPYKAVSWPEFRALASVSHRHSLQVLSKPRANLHKHEGITSPAIKPTSLSSNNRI